MMVELRQQLSCESKEILELAGATRLKRLRDLRDEVCALGVGVDVIDKVDAEIAKTELAVKQLLYVYIDQFAAGRAENDGAARHGLADGRIVAHAAGATR